MTTEIDTVDEIKKIIKEGNYVIGYTAALKALNDDKVQKIFLAKNCTDDQESIIRKRSEFFGSNINKTNLTNLELGRVFKKPYSISFIASLKQ